MAKYPFDEKFRNIVDKINDKRKLTWFSLLIDDPTIPQDLLALGYSERTIRSYVDKLNQKSTDELIELALMDEHNNCNFSPALQVLEVRKTRDVFNKAKKLCTSSCAEERAVGVNIIMREAGHAFLSESTEIVCNLVKKEANTRVLESLAYALCHLRIDHRSQYLKKLITHSDRAVRQAIAFSLAGQGDKAAVDGLITLSNDRVTAIRSWATYGLGIMTEKNSQAIRDALYARVTDKDVEIKHEAIIGLAVRKDSRVLKSLSNALKSKEVSDLNIEAAKELADPALYPLLLRLTNKVTKPRIASLLDEAIENCKPRK